MRRLECRCANTWALDDFVLDLAITPNRGDRHVGVGIAARVPLR